MAIVNRFPSKLSFFTTKKGLLWGFHIRITSKAFSGTLTGILFKNENQESTVLGIIFANTAFRGDGMLILCINLMKFFPGPKLNPYPPLLFGQFWGARLFQKDKLLWYYRYVIFIHCLFSTGICEGMSPQY